MKNVNLVMCIIHIFCIFVGIYIFAELAPKLKTVLVIITITNAVMAYLNYKKYKSYEKAN